MKHSRRAVKESLIAAAAAVLLVPAIDLLTNTLDTAKFSWDFRYYIDLAEHGFAAKLASPFVYRYLTPFLARGISAGFGLSTQGGFIALAYLGAITQLLGVYLFVRWYVGSTRGAWMAMLTTAFSLFNVKFLQFDVFRPDHLAYALIVLQAYFALRGKFVPLLISTVVGVQIREFNVIPLLAYLYASMISPGAENRGEARGKTARELLAAGVGLFAAVVLPRLLIPVAEDFQFASLNRDGILRPLLAPFILARDANFLYSLIAYTLPLLMLAGPRALRVALRDICPSDRTFLGAYTVLVLIFSFLGGTDFYRFSTYLFLPQAIVLARLAGQRSMVELAIILASTFIFNRIWLPFPMSDLNAYLDFYGGSGTHFGLAGVLRIVECAAFIGLGWFARRLFGRANTAVLPA